MYNFILTHNLTINEALLYLASDNGATSIDFKTGLLKIKDLDYSNWLALKMAKIKKINSKLGTRFYRAIIGCLSKIDIDELIHKIELQPTKLVPCSNAKQTRALIEEIYNYKRRNKVNLRI